MNLKACLFPRNILTACLLVAGSALLSACALTDIIKGTPSSHYRIEAQTEDEETENYLQTILDERLKEKLPTLSGEQATRQEQESYIEQTIRADLLKALHAKGYYRADVTFEDGDVDLTGQYNVRYGPQFSIATLEVLPPEYEAHLPADSVQAGMPLDATNVLATQGALYNNIQKGRCYFFLNVDNRVYLQHRRNEADVELVVDAGREGHFGDVSYQGQRRVKESYLRKFIPWKEGDCFRREQLETYKTALLQSGLFARAEIILPEEPEEDGAVPVTVDLRERAARTMRAGATYYSDEGLGLVLGWEHRNLLGAAEKLTAELKISTLNQSISTNFDKPYFLRDDQNLYLSSSLRRQDTDAFEEMGIDVSGGLKRKFNKRLSGQTGINVSLTQIDDRNTRETDMYGLVSAPASLTYDSRDDTLDPTKGASITLSAEPFLDALGESDPFFKTEGSASYYYAPMKTNALVLATKLGLGSIWGTDTDNIPATKRFYAGGGGSVRGYGYQEVGPKRNGDPAGGRSLVTFSFELRSKFTDKIGGVAFVDGGSVTDDPAPTFENMAIGTGVGLRYYTGFGPIRFDIATPLTQKDDIDQNYQFYISIGQAF